MIDIVIPTLRDANDPIIISLIEEINRTAGVPVHVAATCTKASASVNRNLGLDWAKSDVIFMVDDDISGFPVGWVKILEHTIRTQDDCVMLSPQLLMPDHTFGFMMGVRRQRLSGLSTAAGILPTACIAIWANELRFDENFIGSGFEDNDYCAQLRQLNPNARFLVNHDVQVIHANEKKNQHGTYWDHNKAYFEKKWNRYQ